MPTINSAASGNWSVGATWEGGIAPTTADAAVILTGHTVTLDTTGCVCDTATINSGGTLVASTVANSTLTCQHGIANNGTMMLDMSAAAAFTCTVLMNNSNNATSQGLTHGGAANFTHKGAAKKSWTTISGALTANSSKTAVVADATGWRVGDTLIFATTDAYFNPPHTDIVTIATITPGSGTTATVTWTDGAGTGGAILYGHQDTCPVACMTRNVRIGGAALANKSFVALTTVSGSPTWVIQDTEFRNMTGGFPSYPNLALHLRNTMRPLSGVFNCSFRDTTSVGAYQISTDCSFDACAFYNASFSQIQIFNDLPLTNSLILYSAVGMSPSIPNSACSGNWISGCVTGAVFANTDAHPITLSNSHIWACAAAANGQFGGFRSYAFNNTTIGTQFASPCTVAVQSNTYPIKMKLVDGAIQASNIFVKSNYDFTNLEIANKNADAAVQEIYTRHSSTVPVIQRDVSVVTNSTSSIKMTMNDTRAVSTSFDVLVKSNQTKNLLVYVRKSSSPAYGASTLPKVFVSGGATVTMSAGTAADTWELLTVPVTNAGASDKNITITLQAQSAVAGAMAYFSGLPIAPFVTRCRHYGYEFDETIPTRTLNPYAFPTEPSAVAYATAVAYTGATINAGTKRVTFGAGTIDNLQKLFDYSQAWGVANVALEMPWVRAGALLSLNTGWTVADPVFPLATFGGGTVEWNSTGNKTGGYDSTTFDFKTAGTYNFAGATLAGTITLVNTSGGNVTVEVPTGTSYTNTGPNITVSLPVITANINITNLPVAGNAIRLQIYNMSTDTIIYSGDPAGTSYIDSYTDGVGITAGDVLRVRFVELNTSVSFKAFSVIVEAATSGFNVDANNYIETDEVYALNAVDGSSTAVTNKFSASFDPLNPQINLKTASNFIAAEVYAFYCYQLSTVNGIGLFWGGVTAQDVGNYRINAGVLDLYFDNETTASKRQTDAARIYRSDGTYPVTDPTTSGYGIDMNWQNVVYAYATGSGITAQDKTDIAQAATSAVFAQATTTPIHANIKKVNDVTIAGNGVSPAWGPA